MGRLDMGRLDMGRSIWAADMGLAGLVWGAADVDLVITERDEPPGPVREGLGHAEALRRVRGLAAPSWLAPAGPVLAGAVRAGFLAAGPGPGRLGLGRLGGLGGFGGGLGGLGAVALHRGHAGAQDLGQVGGLGLGLGQVRALRADDVVALDLGPDHRLERLAVGVVVLVGLEVLGHGVDERGGHLQLLRPDLDVFVQEREVGLTHLVRPQQGLQGDHPFPDPQRGQRLALAQRDLGHRHLARLLQRVAEQYVGPDAGGVRFGVIALGRVDGLHLGARREMQDLDPVRGHQREVGQVLVGEHHHVAGGQLVALGDVGVGDFLPVQGADAAELDPGAVLAVHLPEGDVTLLGRRVELHRDHDQPEGDGTGPYAAHGIHLPRLTRDLARLCQRAYGPAEMMKAEEGTQIWALST